MRTPYHSTYITHQAYNWHIISSKQHPTTSEQGHVRSMASWVYPTEHIYIMLSCTTHTCNLSITFTQQTIHIPLYMLHYPPCEWDNKLSYIIHTGHGCLHWSPLLSRSCLPWSSCYRIWDWHWTLSPNHACQNCFIDSPKTLALIRPAGSARSNFQINCQHRTA